MQAEEPSPYSPLPQLAGARAGELAASRAVLADEGDAKHDAGILQKRVGALEDVIVGPADPDPTWANQGLVLFWMRQSPLLDPQRAWRDTDERLHGLHDNSRQLLRDDRGPLRTAPEIPYLNLSMAPRKLPNEIKQPRQERFRSLVKRYTTS